ncbi:uncharacterized protein J3D65DRAFT_626276 [Phyllosticta citribraziliensis]|uniref:Uncharacterized protein n=1 Tax=Phyllosticta citribraziliensis TaxID=989973 RepID=A0ABR1LKR8_9PEZI
MFLCGRDDGDGDGMRWLESCSVEEGRMRERKMDVRQHKRRPRAKENGREEKSKSSVVTPAGSKHIGQSSNQAMLRHPCPAHQPAQQTTFRSYLPTCTYVVGYPTSRLQRRRVTISLLASYCKHTAHFVRRAGGRGEANAAAACALRHADGQTTRPPPSLRSPRGLTDSLTITGSSTAQPGPAQPANGVCVWEGAQKSIPGFSVVRGAQGRKQHGGEKEKQRDDQGEATTREKKKRRDGRRWPPRVGILHG